MDAPEGVLLAVATVDVQQRYLATLQTGWSFEGECWLLDYERVEADPRDLETWRQLAQFFNALRFEHPAGDVPLHLVAVDSGYLADTAYTACRIGNAQPGRAGKWWYAVKGVGGLVGEPLLLATRDERDLRGRRGPRPLRINVDEGKAELMAMLSMQEPGAGYVHIPKRLAKSGLLEELTSEERRPRFGADGEAVGSEWKKKTPDARNEGLDCAVYALALYHFTTKSQWLDLLCRRHGRDDGIARFRERHPGERIYGIDEEPRRRSTWLRREVRS